MIWILVAAVLAAPSVKDADVEKRFSTEYRRCAPLAADDMSRFHCITGELQKQNRALEDVIKRRASKFRPAKKRAYVKQQYAWLSARNRQCLKDSKSGPGPIFAEQLKCRLFETMRHTIEIERLR
jgi:uncharacterized protein YecT (DUF1311 family)